MKDTMYRTLPRILRVVEKRQCSIPHTGAVRTLICDRHLGIPAYRHTRENEARRLPTSVDQFRQRMEKFADAPETPAFVGELKQLLHMTTDSPHDQQMVLKVMIRYHSGFKSLRFSHFIFGPVAMRMYWHFKLADRALEAFRHPELEGFFDQLSSFTILMDLLYESGRYEEVLDVLQTVRERRVAGAQFPQNCLIIYAAACYRLNTAAAYGQLMETMEGLRRSGDHPSRRAAALAAAATRQQGHTQRALQFINELQYDKSALLRDIQAICLAELSRPAEAVQCLQKPLLLDLPAQMLVKQAVLTDAVSAVDDAVHKKDDAEVTAMWASVRTGLQSYNLLADKSLETALTETVTVSRRLAPATDVKVAFNRGQRPPPRRQSQRPGLTDMED